MVELTKMGKTLGLSALLLGLIACGGGNSVEERVAAANEFIAAAEYQSAIIELKNALQADSESAEARYLLGKTYLETGDVLSAQKELERARQLGWPEGEVKLGLAQALLAQAEYEQVRDITANDLPPESESNLLALKATAALSLGDSWEAERLIDRALTLTPDSTEALLANARVLAAQGDFLGANAILDGIIARDPDQVRVWSLRGDILTKLTDYTGALAAYDKAVALKEDNYNDVFKRAILNLQLGNFETSQEDATLLLGKAPQHPGSNYIQGLLHFEAGRYDEAITALSVTESAFKQYPAALFFLGSAQLIQGDLDTAAGFAGRFHKLVPNSVRGRKLLATVRLQQGKFSAVSDLLQPVLDADPDDIDALNLSANALLGEGKTNEGIALLSRVAALEPESPVAQVRLGAGLLMGGKGSDATQHIEAALELNPEFQQADILMVLNQLQKRDYPAAIAAALEYQRRHLTDVAPYNLLGKVYLEAGQREEARAAFLQALALESADAAANHSLAQMALAQDDLAAARGYYETVLAEQPESVSTLIQLAKLDAREGNEEAMLERLEQAVEADKTALQPRLLLGRYYLGKARPEQVAPLFTNLPQRRQMEPEVLRLLAMAQLSTKDRTGAQFTLDQLLSATPDSAPIRYMMAMAVAGDEERTMAELKRALELDENHVPTRIALAKLALSHQSMAEFEQHMAALKTLAPDNPNVLLLQASDEQNRGNTQAALSLAEKAFAATPSSGTLIVLASYQEAIGDRDSALESYAKWLDEHPDDTNVRISYANSLQLSQRFDEAGVQYAAVLEVAPDNAIVLNNQAWIVRKQNPQLALEYARKALTLAPNSPEVLDTLAVVEFINEDYQRAARTVARALAASPGNPSVLYHSAMIAAALDDKAGARATLEALLATDADFPEVGEAKALLAQLGN